MRGNIPTDVAVSGCYQGCPQLRQEQKVTQGQLALQHHEWLCSGKAAIGRGLTTLSSQITKVKGKKTSKLNVLRKAIKKFDDDPTNLEIWKNVQVLKEKAAGYGKAFAMLMEACVAAMKKELDAWDEKDECPLRVRNEAAMVELEAYEKDK